MTAFPRPHLSSFKGDEIATLGSSEPPGNSGVPSSTSDQTQTLQLGTLQELAFCDLPRGSRLGAHCLSVVYSPVAFGSVIPTVYNSG